MSTPRPPLARMSACAPTCGASRPATSDIGASSGSERSGQLDRLVRDRGDAGGDERLGALARGGEVQVGEEGLALAHAVVLLRDGLLHLEDEVAGRPHVVGGGEDRGTGGDVLLVGDRGADAGVVLDVDLVAVTHELEHAGRGDGDAVLVVLDLAGDSDLHVRSFACARRVVAPPGDRPSDGRPGSGHADPPAGRRDDPTVGGRTGWYAPPTCQTA